MPLHEVNRIKKRFVYSSFINIVEEPEQNLYPDSQRKIIFELFKALNTTRKNRLVITTHSPYILNFITLNCYAYSLYQQSLTKEKQSIVSNIVSKEAAINPNIVTIYELDVDGSMKNLELEDGFIPDDNKLNYKLEEINEQFSNLLYMEI